MDLIRRPGISTVGAIGATPNASGASVAGSTLTLQPADGSFGGVITTGTQILAGAKTWLSPVRSKPTGLAGLQLDCNAATGDFTLSLSPANLTANRRWTLPNRDDTFAGLGAQTFTGAQIMNSTLTVKANLSIDVTGATAQLFILADDANQAGLTLYDRSGAGFQFYRPAGASALNFYCSAAGTVVSFDNSLTGGANILYSTDATSTTAAALVVAGGVGIAKQLRVGNLLTTTVADGATGMKMKAGTGMFRFRPYVDATNGCVIDSSDASETAYLPFTISALNLRLFGNNGVGVSVGTTGIVQCGSSLEVNSATLIKSNTTLTNGAAAAVGTLTNAPAAGNPTKWIPINDNGTTRYLPAW